MPVVCDFELVQGDAARRIGDGATLWEKNFRTPGREANGHAFLIMMVKGLTFATEGVDVKINNTSVGQIFPHRWSTQDLRNDDGNHWHSEIINVGGANLQNGDNELQIEAIGFPEGNSNNLFDDFLVRNVYCFFQQNA